MSEDKIRRLFLAAIASQEIPKKKLARRCRISRAYLSLMLHGDRIIPSEVKDTLIHELGLGAVIEKLEKATSAGGN